MPLNIDIQQIFLHLLNFVILFAVLYFLLYKPVLNFMNKREEHFREMEEKAKKNLAESEETRKVYEEKLSAADEEIAGMREDARRASAKERNKRLDKAEKEAEVILKRARTQAEEERYRIIQSAKKEVSAIVSEAAAKIIPSPEVSDSYDQFLDSVEGEKE